MDYATVVAIEFIYAIATLAMISLGLTIIFGMMRVINLAHGEFMVLGSYSAAFVAHNGDNMWIAILVVPTVVVGLFGLVVERLIVRHLHGRMVETMLATWGFSLFVSASTRCSAVRASASLRAAPWRTPTWRPRSASTLQGYTPSPSRSAR